MTTFESNIKEIPYPRQAVYNMLSDLQNIERLADKIPDDKAKDLTFSHDEVSVSVPPVGQVAMRVVDRKEPDTIKFESVNSPLPFNFWIQLLPIDDTTTKMKLTMKAEIPFFAKGMVSGPLQSGIDRVADVLAMIPYQQ